MKNLKALTLAALTAAATFAAPAAQARNVDAAHIRLGRAVMATGIELKINPIECNFKPALGWYWAAKKEMVICQENAKGGQAETFWTEEDLDTLRHEAHHLVKDCMARGNRDGLLGAVYTRPIELGYDVLGKARSHRIAELYAENGASAHIQVMEIEAFAVAAINNPLEQVQDIQRYCM